MYLAAHFLDNDFTLLQFFLLFPQLLLLRIEQLLVMVSHVILLSIVMPEVLDFVQTEPILLDFIDHPGVGGLNLWVFVWLSSLQRLKFILFRSMLCNHRWRRSPFGLKSLSFELLSFLSEPFKDEVIVAVFIDLIVHMSGQLFSFCSKMILFPNVCWVGVDHDFSFDEGRTIDVHLTYIACLYPYYRDSNNPLQSMSSVGVYLSQIRRIAMNLSMNSYFSNISLGLGDLFVGSCETITLLLISKLRPKMKNNSKYYYISNENMSDIKESFQEYSQNFEKDSCAQSNYHESIAEDISVSRTNKLVSQNFANKNLSKKSIVPASQSQPSHQEIRESVNKILTEESNRQEIKGSSGNKPVDLGFFVWETIQERYYETNKISTEDLYVLYDFYALQRKAVKPRHPKVLQEEYAKLQKLMPSMKRKMKTKLDFEKMLFYRPEDIMHSLQVAAHMKFKDKQLRKNENLYDADIKKNQKKKTKPINEIVNRLYGESKSGEFSKTKMAPQALEKIRLLEFGKKLSETYQNAMRELPDRKIESVSKLYNYWIELYDREEYGLEWNQERAENDIRLYMIDQVATLKEQYQRKVGYTEGNGNKLLKFLIDNPKLQGVFIPVHSFEEYVNAYNLYNSEKEEEVEKARRVAEEKQRSQRNNSEMKKFGRPMSATPLTILAKPKNKNDYGEIYSKYRGDKLITTMMVEERMKVPRYPFEYSSHDIVDELKSKNRVIPKPKVNFDHAITKALTQTINNFSGYFSPDRDRVMDMLENDSLHKQQTWKEEGEVLQEAMLVKSYEDSWFRQPIVKYLKIKSKDASLDNDKKVFGQLFKYLNGLNQDDRETEIDSLRRFVDTARQLAKRKESLNELQRKDQKFYNNQRKLMYVDLLERVKLFVRKDFEVRTGKSDEKLSKRQFLNETFDLLFKSHKEAVKKFFNVIETKNSIEDKECPKLLRYQFYRLCKQINPENYERDERPKAPNWVPTRKSPDSFNYKSHNQWSKAYKKDKNRQPFDPEPEERSNSLWGYKKGKERETLLMTYSDAQECYFHPKIKKLM